MQFIEKGQKGVIDRLSGTYPTILYANVDKLLVPRYATAFGFVVGQPIFIHRNGDCQKVSRGQAFSVSDVEIDAPNNDLHVTVRYGFVGQQVFGVELEEFGRVTYIDSCTDSLLIYPPRKGDPCLNSLHFPPSIEQTFHIHPSIRMGVIASGEGVACVKTTGGNIIETSLKAGMAWCIDAYEQHRFRTFGDKGMTVIAFHPDSNWGPEDETHPMINRTYIK